MRILVLGVTGMLGNAIYRVFSESDKHEVWGTLRSDSGKRHFSANAQTRLVSGVDVLDQDMLVSVLRKIRPNVVINCVGLIKQLELIILQAVPQLGFHINTSTDLLIHFRSEKPVGVVSRIFCLIHGCISIPHE